MPRLRMTDLAIKNLKTPPKPEQQDYFDDPAGKGGVRGLLLRHSYGGTKTWRVMVYRNGVSQSFALGRYPVLKLSEARDAAIEFARNYKKTGSPKPAKSPPTFSEVADDYLAKYVNAPTADRDHALRTASVIKQRIDKHLRPKFKHYEFSAIGRAELAELLDEVQENHKRPMAQAVLTIFKSIASWYEVNDNHYRSPVVRKMRRYRSKSREHVLTDAEIRAFWSATGDLGIFGGMCRVLLLTGQRRTKVNMMQWDHIKDGIWDIRKEPGEKGNPGLIKLPQMALDIIEAQPRLKNNPYIFSGLRGRGPFNSIGQYTDLLFELEKTNLPEMRPHTTHDLRRTFRTRLSELEISRDTSERCIGHKVGGDVENTYDRYEYFKEKTEAFQKFADHIAALIIPPPANVVPLTGRRRPQRASIRAVQGGSDVSTHEAPR